MASAVEVDGQLHSDDSQKLNDDVSHEESDATEEAHPHPDVNGVGKEENGTTEHATDLEKDNDASDAQAQVIASLRSQVTDLFTQVTQLNSKLVSSYDRVSDLEDQLHVSSASLRNATLQVSELELERTQHLAALNTGLLVEREHVTAELNRLMERATLEAAQRGQAESARQDIEKDLDDLSASLFDQANTMVAEARLAAAVSERKAGDAEEALKTAEEAVRAMQVAMQELMAEREKAQEEAERARIRMGKGKWVDRGPGGDGVVLERQVRLMNTHQPFVDFLSFVGHLRSLRASGSAHTPAMSALLSLPFLARLLTEDSEPTLRLDLAPSLNWLTRRSVLAAVNTGMLSIEPIPLFFLLQELYPHASLPPPPSHLSHPYAENHPLPANVTLSCALCGTSILPPPTPPSLALAGGSGKDREREKGGQKQPTRNLSGNSTAWLRGLTSSSSINSNSNLVTEETATSSATTEAVPMSVPEQIFVFRLNTQSSSLATLASTPSSMPSIPNPFSASSPPPSHPSHLAPLTSPGRASSSSQSIKQLSGSSPARAPGGGGAQQTQQQPTPYPLCASNYCLMRLRSTCSLWAFVRSGIVEHVWEEPVHLPPLIQPHAPVLAPGSPPARPSTPGRDRDSQRGISFGFGGGSSPGKKVIPSPPPSHPSTTSNADAQNDASGEKAPPVPPRRRGLWGMASALGEAFQERGRGKPGSKWGSRDVSGDQSMAASGRGAELAKDGPDKEGKGLPPPPPSHPDAPHEYATAPPPLPRRNTDRKQTASGTPPTTEAAVKEHVGEEEMNDGHEEHGEVKEETLFDAGHDHGHGHEEKHDADTTKANEENTAMTPAAEDKEDAFLTPTEEAPAQSLADASLVTPPATPGPTTSRLESSELSVTDPEPAGSSLASVLHRRSLDADVVHSPGAVPLPPSRTDSPAPVSMAVANGNSSGSRSVSPAPQGGGGVPPPIPRRAPARRPAPAPPGTPAAVPPTASTPVVEGKKEEATEEQKGLEYIETGEPEPTEASQEGNFAVDNSVKPVNVEVPIAASEPESIAAPVADADLETQKNEQSATVDGTDEPKQEGEGAQENKSGLQVQSEAKAEAAEEKEAPSDPGFTTDTTWEERSWREVVRLREEMFWARVGGVR